MQFTTHNQSLKAQILSEPRPAVRSCSWRAYTAFMTARDLQDEGEEETAWNVLRTGAEWLIEAQKWAEIEVCR